MSKLNKDIVFKIKVDDKELEVKLDNADDLWKAFERAGKTSTKAVEGSLDSLKQRLSRVNKLLGGSQIGSDRFEKLANEASRLKTEIAQAEKHTNSLDDEAHKIGMSFSDIGNIVTGINQGLELMQRAWEYLSKPINISGEFERYNVQFEVLLGSVDAAEQRIDELAEFAAKTPFEFPEIIRASKQLEVMTNGAISTGDSLTLLGDVSAGVGAPIDELSVWFGRLYDAIQSGRPMGEAMMRLQELGAISGEARGEIEGLQKSGADANVIWETFTGSMDRFNGMMIKQSETYEGMSSNLEDAGTLMMKSWGDEMLPVAKDVVATVIRFAEELTIIPSNFEKVSEKVRQQRIDFESLVFQYEQLRTTADKTNWEKERLSSVIAKLQDQYPEYLGNLDLEKGKLEDVKVAFENVRKEMIANMRLELRKAKVQDVVEEQENLIDRLNKQQENLLDSKTQLDQISKGILENELFTQGINVGGAVYYDKKSFLERSLSSYEEAVGDLEKQIAAKQAEINKESQGLDMSSILGLDDADPDAGGGGKDKIDEFVDNSFSYIEDKVNEDLSKLEFDDIILPDLKLASDIDLMTLEAEMTTDQFEQQSLQLEIWRQRELERYADDARAKEMIEESFTQKKLALKQQEAETEIQLAQQTMGLLAGMVNQNTAAGKAIAAVSAYINTKEGATKALAQGGFWGIAQMAIIIAAGLEQVNDILSAEVPQMPGYARGGRLPKGQAGFVEGWQNEVIAPEKTFIELFRSELRPQIYGNSVQSNNNELLNEIRSLNNNMEKYAASAKAFGDDEIYQLAQQIKVITNRDSF